MNESPIVKQQFNIVFKDSLKASLKHVTEYNLKNKLLNIQGVKSSSNPRKVVLRNIGEQKFTSMVHCTCKIESFG